MHMGDIFIPNGQLATLNLSNKKVHHAKMQLIKSIILTRIKQISLLSTQIPLFPPPIESQL